MTWALVLVANAHHRDGATVGEAMEAVVPAKANQFTASDPGG